MGIASFTIERTYRIGRKKEGETRPRPFFVKMGSAYQKSLVLKRAHTLAHLSGLQSVFIRADMDSEARKMAKGGAALQVRDVPVPAAQGRPPGDGDCPGVGAEGPK